ncbi:Cof-type HAD-IIB family hydrolase [Lactobacillus sp. CBA3605]|uniref:HAD family hydrolase n=1 Tax=Lactobacillus sp. CBA3605 TaxID=2099788 RepID=UPI000CFD555C|nr:HAD family hydrolase [Lactobacillus sp. CBA3605]AVK61615.1 Cof-type HAD-IIB family hydrolase [Lactobacillus sp. CBA3605]
MMTPYLIFSDVDGTLMIDHTHLTTVTQQTLNQVMARGHHFYIATGRMLPLARQAAEQIGGPVKIIAANGATFELGDQLQTAYLSAAQLTTIYQTVLGHDCKVFFFETDRLYYTGDEPPYQADAAQANVTTMPDLNALPLIGPEYLPNLAGYVTNAIAYGDPSKLAAIRAELGHQTQLNLSSSNTNNLELIPQGVDKASAITTIQQATGIDRAHTLVFGDGLNDLGMFQVADYSIAMGNAPDIVKQAATAVTLPNTQDGVAVYLQDFFKLTD